MYDQQQQRINRAAQEFTEALVAAYKTTSESTAVAQELGARQIEYFFDAVIGNLRAQAGGTSQMARQLAGQQRLAQETTRDLARVSTDNYMDLLDSVFSFYQGGASRTQRRADEARGHIEEAEARARSEAESQTEEAKRSTSVAKRRATEAEKRASEAESRAEEAKGRAEEAEARAEQAQEQSRETERRLQEAQRRALEAERARSEAERSRNEAESRAEEAERARSEAESRGGDEEGDTEADAASQPQSQWVRTSGRSKVRGRDTRARNRSSGRRR
jgi:chromosome segregation ATPase